MMTALFEETACPRVREKPPSCSAGEGKREELQKVTSMKPTGRCRKGGSRILLGTGKGKKRGDGLGSWGIVPMGSKTDGLKEVIIFTRKQGREGKGGGKTCIGRGKPEKKGEIIPGKSLI